MALAHADTSSAGAGGRADRKDLVLLVCSSGGHLAQLLPLQPWLSGKRARWVTFPTEDARSQLVGQDVVDAYFPTTRNVVNLLRNFFLAWKLLRADRPDLILSSGAGVAVPFFVLGWIMRIPRIYIEVFDRLDTPTLTGRLCRPFATKMLVQWDEQAGLYKGAEVAGTLL